MCLWVRGPCLPEEAGTIDEATNEADWETAEFGAEGAGGAPLLEGEHVGVPEHAARTS